MRNKLLSVLLTGAFLATSVSASWVVVNNDGSTSTLTSCCKKAPVKRVVKKVKAPEVCETCDYSTFKDAKLLPIGNEKLQAATLKNCGK
ncbi:MAG TPA: hypothetical protein EYH01_06725 [Campylobacterales bacterium]|nr:hypothetical protein [Campylobacterales bacterium]